MSVAPLNFNGATIYRPGYYVKRNIEAGGKAGGISLNTIVVIGNCEGGIPHNANLPDEDKLMFFSKSGDAKTALRRGDALEAVKKAFEGLKDARVNAGANEVAVLRANPATASALVLNNTDPAAVINLVSVDYGLHTTGISTNISAGTTGKLVEVKKEQDTISIDNVIREVITIAYTGPGTAATLTKTATTITSAVSGEAGVDLNLNLNTFKTVREVVEAIEAISSYTVSIPNPEFNESSSKEIDIVSAIDIKASAKTLSSNVQAVIDAFNTTGIVTASIDSEAERKDVDNLSAFVYMTGGTEGATTVNEWGNALDLAFNREVNYVGAMTGDSAVHALLSSHIAQANAVKGRKERRGFTGASRDDNESTIRSKAAIFGSQFGLFYGPDDYNFDVDGQQTNMAGYIHSAGCAGASAGNAITMPLTHKIFNIVKAKRIYSETEIENFIKAGVVLSTPVPGGGGYRIERSITAYTGTNLIANEWSMIGTALAITQEHRIKMDARFVGVAGTVYAQESLESYSLELLEEFLERGWFTENPKTGEQAITNHVVTVFGDTYKITYDGILTAPINFIPATHNFTILGAGR